MPTPSFPEELSGRIRALLGERAETGEAAINIAAVAERLSAEFLDLDAQDLSDEIARTAIDMGLSIEFGPEPR